MKKKFITIMFFILLVLAGTMIFAACGANSDKENPNYNSIKSNLIFVEDGDGYTVFSNGHLESDIVIASEYNGKPVLHIGDHAFDHCIDLTSVTIPNSITSIGDYAFSGCSSLTYVTIPNSVTSIGAGAFEYCESLLSIEISSSVTKIEGNIVSDCYNLISINVSAANSKYHSDGNCLIETESNTIIAGCKTSVIPSDGSVTSIGKYAFYDCSSLTSIEIPNNVTSIGSRAFYWCNGLTIYCEATSKPNGWDKDWNALYYASSTSSFASAARCPVVWDCKNNDKDENGYAYDVIDGMRYRLNNGKASVVGQPKNISGDIVVPDIITYNDINYEVNSINQYAFNQCCYLSSVKIPDSVTFIGNYTFGGCYSLTSVYIPNSVTYVGQGAFSLCNSLIVYCEAIKQPSSWYRALYASVVWDCKNNDKIDEFAFTVVDGVHYKLKDGEASVMNCQPINLKGAVVIPSTIKYKSESYNVTEIADNAFRIGGVYYDYENNFLSKITSITIPKTVESIGASAFSDCHRLTYITVDDSNLNYVSRDGVLYNKDLTEVIHVPNDLSGSVVIPKTVSSITAFVGRCGITSISVESGNTIFYSVGNCIVGKESKTIIVGCNNSVLSLDDSVTSIGERAFYGCRGLTSIIIPDSVTSIGERAFYGCRGLTSIIIPDSVTSIDDSAFEDCSSLASVTIGNSVTNIGDSAFEDCSSLASVTIGNSVTNIGDSAFEDCSSLASVTIPNSVTSVGESTFEDCDSLTNVTIGNGVTSIGYRAFYNCVSLTDIEIPNSVTRIESNAFEDCGNLETVYWNATACTYAGSDYYQVFTNCCNLTTIIIGDNVTSIPAHAFEDCGSLTSLTIGDGVTSIGERAFYGCSSLTSIKMPNSVTSIGSSAFSGCSGLMSVYYLGNIVSWCELSFDGSSANPLACAKNLYINNELVIELILSDTITEIKAYAFYGCSSLTSVTIGNSVTSIGDFAFYGCSSLTSVTIGNSVTSVGNRAFYGCSSITSLTIGNSVTSVGDHAFYGCSSLTSIEIPNSVTSISGFAFGGCSSLTSIEIPNSVTSIQNYAFNGCSSLTSITVQSGNTKYHSSDNCLIETATKRLILGCNNSAIPIDGSVTSINNSAFSGCSDITSIAIPIGVTSIENQAFEGCSSLTSIEIPNSITSIGIWAFSGCRSLTSIVYNGTMAQWNAISKGSSWNSGTGNYTVTCTDGTITK